MATGPGSPRSFTSRLATPDDLDALRALMDAAIAELQKPFLDPAQIVSSRTIMGLDTQLIKDGTYFVVEERDVIAGCGGWSRRATLYGGDLTPGRDAALLDPAKDAARVRAMYTHPAFVRRGIGRLILSLCEEAARAEGLPARRAHGDDVRRAALPRLRLSAGRVRHGRPRRRRGADVADVQDALRSTKRVTTAVAQRPLEKGWPHSDGGDFRGRTGDCSLPPAYLTETRIVVFTVVSVRGRPTAKARAGRTCPQDRSSAVPRPRAHHCRGGSEPRPQNVRSSQLKG